MSVTLFGSCRINGIHGNNNLNERVTYTHTTKEAIQLIHFLKNDIAINDPMNIYCFRSGIMQNTSIPYNPEYTSLFFDSSICIVEICSRKLYCYETYYLHHLSVDTRFEQRLHTPDYIKQNHHIRIQSKEEIEQDILALRQLVFPKPFIIVSHYNSMVNGQVMPLRDELINELTSICQKHAIHFVNPTIVLNDYPQEAVMQSDLGHYTEEGLRLISDYLNSFVQTILNG